MEQSINCAINKLINQSILYFAANLVFSEINLGCILIRLHRATMQQPIFWRDLFDCRPGREFGRFAANVVTGTALLLQLHDMFRGNSQFGREFSVGSAVDVCYATEESTALECGDFACAGRLWHQGEKSLWFCPRDRNSSFFVSIWLIDFLIDCVFSFNWLIDCLDWCFAGLTV